MRPAAREVLSYLRDLGWDDLYLEDRAAVAVAASEVARASTSAESIADQAAVGERGAAASFSPAPPPTVEQLAACTSLAELDALAQGCTACPLALERNKVVFGSGSAEADLMFIGEGPGAQEDRMGLPFVGPAGELLTKIIAAIDLRREDCYIGNVVKCRPPRNRDPQPGEVAACIGYLRRQIALVRPRVIVALGRVAAQALLQTDAPVGRMRGQWHSFEDVPLRVTYHPAALLRNASLKRPAWEDLQVVRDRLQELATKEGDSTERR